MLSYNRLPHALFSDTLISGSFSKCGNKYSQIYGVSFGWARALPVSKKGETYETLSFLFKRDVYPPKMIVYGAKEHILVNFNNKLKEANCHLIQTYP